MARVTPRRIVSFIEKMYPWAKTSKSQALYADQLVNLGTIASLVRRLPDELQPSDPDDFTLLVAAVASIEAGIQMWAGMSPSSASATPLRAFVPDGWTGEVLPYRFATVSYRTTEVRILCDQLAHAKPTGANAADRMNS